MTSAPCGAAENLDRCTKQRWSISEGEAPLEILIETEPSGHSLLSSPVVCYHSFDRCDNLPVYSHQRNLLEFLCLTSGDAWKSR